MCGIWGYIITNDTKLTDFTSHEKFMMASAPRGPDRLCELKTDTYHMCFHRLAIHDLSIHGDQPFSYEDDNIRIDVMCNGEIYNWKELIKKHTLEMTSGSDCEVILQMLKKYYNHTWDDVVTNVIRELRGEFAAVIRIENAKTGTSKVYATRDPYGVRPLYYAKTQNGVLFSSVLAGIVGFEDDVKGHHVPPGVVLNFIDNAPEKRIVYYDVSKIYPLNDRNTYTDIKVIYKNITDRFIDAVERRLDSERNIGFLLSGGLDSSLVVAVATKILGYKHVSTFSIGMRNATDLKYAREVANHLQTDHTEVVFTKEEGLAAIVDVIRTLETYDITTIRASVGQYLLAKYISTETNIKVVLNGDGADETECGYLYFHYAPSPEDAHKECQKLLSEIHMYDALRVDRTISSHGLEARVPFLDNEFVDAYLTLPASLRVPKVPDMPNGRMEKAFIRDAFAILYPDILPTSVLYRKKEAFSDGVSDAKESWFISIQKWIDEQISDDEYNTYIKQQKEGDIEITTKEAYYYRKIFLKYFPGHEHILKHYWLPNWTNAKDPSARTLSIY